MAIGLISLLDSVSIPTGTYGEKNRVVLAVTIGRKKSKVMCSLGEETIGTVMAERAELDERSILKSHKGTKLETVAGKKRGTPSSKRGISNDQICLLTGVQRGGSSYFRSFNMGRPSADEVMNLLPHIEQKTYVWTDACASYNRLIKELGSDSKVVSSKKDYDKVNHLNNVNSFHSMVEKWYQDMSGVASKYINRYAALFNLRYQIGKMDPSEALLFVRSRLRGIKTNTFMTIEQLKQDKPFNPP
jgi:hypothetical protein